MTATATRTGIVHLTERTPQISGAEMVASLVPPPQFDGRDVRVLPRRSGVPVAAGGEGRRSWRSRAWRAPRPAADSSAARRRGRSSSRASTSTAASASARPTCSRRSITRCRFAGSTSARSSSTPPSSARSATRTPSTCSAGSDLLCIDEFELDDPGDTMVMTRLLGELVASGTRLAATSNTPPNALGEGRFAAQDFLREIHAMSASFETIRIDGTDYRHRALDGHAAVLERRGVRGDDRGCRDAAASSRTTPSPHSSRTSRPCIPSRYIRLIDGLDAGRTARCRAADGSVRGAALRGVHRPRLRRAAADPCDRGDPRPRLPRGDARRRLPQEVPARDLAPGGIYPRLARRTPPARFGSAHGIRKRDVYLGAGSRNTRETRPCTPEETRTARHWDDPTLLPCVPAERFISRWIKAIQHSS